jgi:hypothetical protein
MIELSHEGYTPTHSGRFERSFECYDLSCVPFIGGSDRVEGSCDGYDLTLFYFGAYITLCDPFFNLCPRFIGLARVFMTH